MLSARSFHQPSPAVLSNPKIAPGLNLGETKIRDTQTSESGDSMRAAEICSFCPDFVQIPSGGFSNNPRVSHVGFAALAEGMEVDCCGKVASHQTLGLNRARTRLIRSRFSLPAGCLS